MQLVRETFAIMAVLLGPYLNPNLYTLCIPYNPLQKHNSNILYPI